MLTMKDVIENPNQSSPDGKHWEPALPQVRFKRLRDRFHDAWAVWKGEATAVRQTTKADLGLRSKT